MIVLININKSYGDFQVLHDISIEFKRGEIVFLVGDSGCGKTTMLNLIGGLDSVDSGKILFDDREITHNDTSYKSKDVAFVFQEFNLIAGLSVEQNIAISKNDFDKKWIDENASNLGVKPKQKAHTLSGGQKQRVAILRALYKDTSILLADEPTGNLDKRNSKTVFENIRQLQSQNKIIIVVTHDINAAKEYGDRIVELSDGVVISDTKNEATCTIQEPDNEAESASAQDSSHVTETFSISSQNQETETVSIQNKKQEIQIASKSNQNNLKRTGNSKHYFANSAITANYIKRNIVRFILLAILFSIGISLSAISLEFKNTSLGIVNNKIVSMDADLSRVNVVKQFSQTQYTASFDEKSLEYLKSQKDIKTVVDTYSDDPSNMNGYDSAGTISIFNFSTTKEFQFETHDAEHRRPHLPILTSGYVREIEYNSFFKDRLMLNDIDGNFPTHEDEMILSQDLARSIFGVDYGIIGKKLYIFTSNASNTFYYNVDNPTQDDTPISDATGIELTVVGVNKSKDAYSGEPISYVSNTITKQLMVDNNKDKNIKQFMIPYGEKQFDTGGNSVGGIGLYRVYPSQISTPLSLKQNEIALSKSALDAIFPFYSDTLEPGQDFRDLNILINPNNKLVRTLNRSVFDTRVRIVAVFDDIDMPPSTATPAKSQIVVSDDLMSQFTQIRTVYADIYTNNPQNFESFQANLNSGEYRFSVQSRYNDLIDSIKYDVGTIGLTYLILGFAVAILFFTCLSVIIITKINISKRKYEIATFKSLGFSKLRIVWLFIYENLFLSLGSFLLAFLFYYIGMAIFKYYVLDEMNIVMSSIPSIWILFVSLIMAIVCIFISILFVLGTASNKTAKLFSTSQ